MDLALATPVNYVEIDDNDEISRGDICIPLKQVGDLVHCFFPAGADDDDKPLPLSSLLQYESSVVPERVQPGFPITIKKGKYVDYVSIPSGHNLVEGDELIVRGKSYNIIAISDDGLKNCIHKIRMLGERLYTSWYHSNSAPVTYLAYNKTSQGIKVTLDW